MVYSVNLVRQFYVADANAAVVVGADKSLVIQTTDALGKVQSSDVVDPKNVEWVHYTSADAQAIKLKKVTVTLDDAAFPNGKTISGQDYILRINFRKFVGMSDEDIYQKYGAVHGTSTMTKADFIVNMVYSLIKNMSREQGKLLAFGVGDTNPAVSAKKLSDGTIVLYDIEGNEVDPSGATTSFDIIEASQVSEWALGTKQLIRVYFDVVPTTVTEPDSYDEIVWATTAEAASGETIDNGYNIADMEYFFHGYRGDQYRNVMWPKVIPTKYQIDPTAKYDVLDIQYHYKGDNEDIQHSAKTITVVTPVANSAVLLDIAEDVCEAAGCAGKKVTVSEGATVVEPIVSD